MALASSVNDVEAERRFYGGAGVADAERKSRVLETLDHLSPTESTEIAPCLGRTTIGVFAREGGEITAVLKLLRDVRDLSFGFFFAARCGGTLRARVHEKNV